MNKNKEPKNPWTHEDELEHYPSVTEWWAAEGFIKSEKDSKKWCFKGTFSEWYEPNPEHIGNIYNFSLFNQDENKHYDYVIRDNKEKLNITKDKLEIKHDGSFLKGKYPNYEMRFVDPENEIQLNINYHAKALPRWIGQDISNGYLPMGLGCFRYGFIPRCEISGSIMIKGKRSSIKGTGYYEHVWGNFSYDNPFSKDSEMKKSLSTYSKLIGWWIHNNKLKIPSSITFSTENNPFGYDWTWALFDNGWSLFFGNSLFWIMEGSVAGSLIFTKDGKNYTEFGNIRFHYNKTQYAKDYDFYYPTEFEIVAKNDFEKLQLTFSMTSEPREFVNIFPYAKKFWIGFAICEGPGVVKGYYYDGKEKTVLSGICKIEPQRQISIVGHNSLKLDFLKPPKGVGISVNFESHFFEKIINVSLQLAPSPKLKFNFQRIDRSKINKKNTIN
jgi:hypothetical protein